MPDHTDSLKGRTALITGAAHRIGNAIVRCLHADGANIVLHYRNSRGGAQALQSELNQQRPDSVALVQADLHVTAGFPDLAKQAFEAFGHLDILVNNASSFYPTPVGEISESHWDDLMGTNLKAPLFLSQAVAPYLRQGGGCIVNMVDIHADRPLREHPVYSVAKAGLVMLTKALAAELGPEVRVNAVAPGAILWPESDMEQQVKDDIIRRTFLKRRGDPDDIARAVRFLARDATYVTGQVLAVDGGRSLFS